MRDVINAAATSGQLGDALNSPATGYSVVYHVEIAALFITLIALGPLVKTRPITSKTKGPIGLADFPT